MKKRDILLSAVSGILLIFSFPNLDFGFFAWFALVPLFYAVEGKNLLHALVLGLVTGFTSFLGIIYWIIVAVHTYGNVPLILSALILLLLIAYLSLYVGTFTFLTRFLQNHFGFQIIILCPLLWVGLEYLRSFFLTGFPWAILGYSQHLNLPFIQSADILGAYGLSFALVLVERDSLPHHPSMANQELSLSGRDRHGHHPPRFLRLRICENRSRRTTSRPAAISEDWFGSREY